MNLADFYSESRADIERFARYWRVQSGSAPDLFPTEMEPGDWFDQFLMFLNSEDSTSVSPDVKRRQFKTLPVEVIQESLSYDPETGLLRWKRRPEHHFTSKRAYRASWRAEGRVAGGNNGLGYIAVHVQYMGETYNLFAHRVAFCLQTGSWPVGQVDHIDGNRANNAWINLRESTPQDNARNTRARRHNSLGLKWVRKSRDGKRYQARATVNGKSYNFGTFDTAEEAQAAAIERLKAVHGEFLNTGVAA